MSVTAVVGMQWGDEAKGKLVDLLSPTADLVARFNGGDNAGHTVVNQFGTFKLRLMPNGFTNPKSICAIGPGVVLNLATLMKEIQTLHEAGIDIHERLWVSPRCNVVMPYHPLVEGVFEEAKGGARTGTTRRGMGPVFADKASYNGITLYDLADETLFAAKLRVQLGLKNNLLQAYGVEGLAFDVVYDDLLRLYEQVRPMVREPFGKVQELLKAGGAILLEGAQGALLDNTWGTYPFCTASTTTVGGASAGLGIAPRHISSVVGVAKAYTTRVGGGPMPTELEDADGQALQQAGAEFGTVTGRARRCGWFDAELVGFTAQLNGATELALTKLDVLDGFERIRICTGYRLDERPLHYWEMDAPQLQRCQPVYIEVDGWMAPTRDVRRFADLPALAQAYVRKVEELTETPVRWVSVGPERDATIEI
ncbi:MAG: adenylosuccinate synthase [Chloroflexota bacterium]